MQGKKSFRIFAVPLFSDNYSYIVRSPKNFSLMLIDPAVPEVISSCLDKYFTNSTVSHIFYTHKHYDHAGGAKQLFQALSQKNKDLKVYAGSEDAPHIGTVNHSINNQQSISLSDQGFLINPYQVPCHTRGHTLYNFKPQQFSEKQPNNQQDSEEMVTSQGKKIYSFSSEQCIFTGDTLFSGGVGRFFEGNAEEMYANLTKIHKNVTKDCDIFNGHQYTLANLKWGNLAEPQNKQIQQQLHKLQNTEGVLCTIPSNIERQRNINVFLRAASLPENKFKIPGVKYLHVLRQAKNNNSGNLEQFLEKI